MHRMTKWVLAAAMACVLGTGAVAVAEDSYYLELPTKGITASRKITVNVPDENPAQDGINPLTGESWYGNYYPILVNIDAHPEALPHWGVASADISYEMPIQSDGSTRADGQPARDVGRRMGVLRLADLAEQDQHYR